MVRIQVTRKGWKRCTTFKMKMVWKENRDKGINHQNVIGKKNAFGFPDKWQIRIAFLQISQASFT